MIGIMEEASLPPPLPTYTGFVEVERGVRERTASGTYRTSNLAASERGRRGTWAMQSWEKDPLSVAAFEYWGGLWERE